MRIVKLTAQDNRIEGKYSANDALVLVECDSTDAAFTVVLPSYTIPVHTEFVLVKTDSGSNAITVETRDSETIDGVSSFTLTAQYHDARVVPGTSGWHRADQGFLR